MRRIKRFLLYWIHNSALIYLSTQIFPGKFVLGNARFSSVWALILSGFALTVIFELSKIGISKVKKPKIDGCKKYLAYLVINFAGLWIIARLAPFSGFGVVGFTWLIGLAVILNLVQKAVSQLFEVKK